MLSTRSFCNSLLLSSLLLTLTQCKTETDTDEDVLGNWVRSSDFDGYARSEGVVFTIGDKVYLSTGTTDRERFKDLWEYDSDKKYWSQKADLPETAAARSSAVAFSINDKGYLGTGYDGNNNLKDFWEYDQETNTWNAKKDFGGSARRDAVAFTVNGKGYISSGFDGNYLKDLWEYNPSSDAWTQKASVGGSKRSEATAFVLNNKAYICSGINNGSSLNDLWMYDPTTDTWTEKRKISNVSDETYDDDYAVSRSNAVSFVMGNFAYVTTGVNGSSVNDTWEYHPETDLWEKKTSFEGSARVGAVAFTIKGRGFVLTGRSGSVSFDNMYEFLPAAEYNDND